MSHDPTIESTRRSYTHEEALAVARQYMREAHGIAKHLAAQEQDRYMEKLGLLVDFLHTLHPPTDTEIE